MTCPICNIKMICSNNGVYMCNVCYKSYIKCCSSRTMVVINDNEKFSFSPKCKCNECIIGTNIKEKNKANLMEKYNAYMDRYGDIIDCYN